LPLRPLFEAFEAFFDDFEPEDAFLEPRGRPRPRFSVCCWISSLRSADIAKCRWLPGYREKLRVIFDGFGLILSALHIKELVAGRRLEGFLVRDLNRLTKLEGFAESLSFLGAGVTFAKPRYLCHAGFSCDGGLSGKQQNL
jgi:hypothetical protein